MEERINEAPCASCLYKKNCAYLAKHKVVPKIVGCTCWESDDVGPVRHARWEPTGWMRGTYSSKTREHEYRCSGCRREKIWKKKTQKLPNYCGNCGAKMDEEKK